MSNYVIMFGFSGTWLLSAGRLPAQTMAV